MTTQTPGPGRLGQHGTTLVELMIALVAFVLVVTGIFYVWNYSQRAYFQGAEAADLQQNVRAALEQMTREIRQAGYDPCRYQTCPGGASAFAPVHAGVLPIQAYSATSLWIRADRNADGDADDADESVCFYVDGAGVLRRKTTGGDCSSGGEELARNISMTLTYLTALGAPAASWSDIKLVRIALTGQELFMGTPLKVILQSDVYLRDR